ncbi:MAG: recombinase family protein [Gammaproteobacteria bacterium]|nr:recombinase family protein [Gammaproteobacteria bacterium]
MASGIRSILKNERYKGELTWNKTQWTKDPDTGVRKCHPRSKSEWERHHDEKLRIVPDELFAASERRFEEGTNSSSGLRRGGRSKYLLSGLLKCNECGANYILTGATSHQCSGKAGGDACNNRVGVRRDVIEDKILGSVVARLLEPERAKEMAREIERQVREHYENLAEKSTPAEVEKIDARIERLRDRLTAGDDDFEPDEIAAALEVAESKRQDILDAQPAARQSAKILVALPKLADVYRRQIKKGLSDNPREVAKARVILRDLLGPIRLCPESDGGLVARYENGSEALMSRAVGAAGFSGSGGRI